MNNNIRRVIRYLVLVLFLALIAWIVYWLSNQSRITILLPEQSTSASAIIKSGNNTINLSLESNQITVRVPKNTYSVLIELNSESYFSVVETKSFLASVEINADLKPQKQRVFVGDDPGSCTNYFNNTLVSYGCTGQLYDLKLHIPSTDIVPTYSKSVRSVLNSVQRDADQSLLGSIGEIEGVIENRGTLYVLAKQPFIEGKEILSHILYSIKPTQNNLEFRFIERLTILNPESSYKMAGTVDDLYIYNVNDFSDLYVGTINDIKSVDANESLEIDLFEPFLLLENNDTFLQAYREAPTTVEDFSNDSLRSIVYTDGKQTTLDTYLTDIQACGSNFCALNDSGDLTVYDVTFEEELVIPGVQSFKAKEGKDSIFLSFDDNVVVFSLTSLDGYSQFDYEGYEFVAFGSSAGDFPVVTLRSAYKQHAISITDAKLEEEIEDVITGLNDRSVINTISLNRNNLFISPELGNLDYFEGSDSLDYNPVVKKVVGDAIKQKLQTIDTYNLNITINNITN